MDGVALKIQLSPGEYHCTVVIPDEGPGPLRLPGILELRADDAPLALVHGEVPVHYDISASGRSADFPQVRRFKQLVAELVNGLRVTLVQAQMTVWFDGQADIRAQAAVLTAGGEQALAASAVRLQIEHLDALSPAGPLMALTYPTGSASPDNDNRTWSAVQNPDSSQSWSRDGTTLRLSYDASVTFADPYFFRMAFSPVLDIDVPEPMALQEWVTQWVQPLTRVVALATGKPAKVTYLTISAPSHTASSGAENRSWSQVYGRGITQTPFASRRRDVQDAPAALILDAQEIGLLDIVSRWSHLAQVRHPMIETYGTFLGSPVQHPRAEFLLLLQALEGLYGHENQAKIDTRVLRHQQRREEALQRVRKALPDDLKFIDKHLMKRPLHSLDVALRWCLTQAAVDLSPTLDACALVATVQEEYPTESTLGCFRRARNHLAHGTRGYAAEELGEVVTILRDLVRGLLLNLLGASVQAQRRAVADLVAG